MMAQLRWSSMVLLLASASKLVSVDGLISSIHVSSQRNLQAIDSPTSAPTILEDGGFTQEPSLDHAPTGAPTILEGEEFLGGVGGLSTVVPSTEQRPSSMPNAENQSPKAVSPGSHDTSTTTIVAASKSPSLPTGAIVGIALGVGMLAGIILSALFIACRSRCVERTPSVVMVQKTHSNKMISSASRGSSKGTEEEIDCPDNTEYSCTASSSRGLDLQQQATPVSVKDPRYTPYALRILEEDDAEEHILVDV